MFNLKSINLLTFFAVFSLITMLTACSNSNDDPVLPVFDPAVAPQNVQVVSGDDNTTDVRNTISWTLDPAATAYVVYVGNITGVDESSSVVVPTASGFNYVTHSGLNAGNTYYYVVQAVSGDQSSILSAEVTGTPQQSITANALNDVAWNGLNTLVAVGDSGVILSSPNGVADAWTDVSDVTVPESLKGVTWEGVNSQFLIVGAGLTVLTGDGTTWNKEDLGNLSITATTDLEDVTWLGTGYIAVGQNGTIISSNIDGSVWAERSLKL